MNVIKLAINDIKIMSVNESYSVNNKRVVLNSKASQYINAIKEAVLQQLTLKQMEAIKTLGDQELLHVNVVYTLIHNEIYTKQGRIKRRDLDNMHKHTIDGLFHALNIYNELLNDCQIFSQNIEKCVSNDESTHIYIELMRQMQYKGL